MISNVQAERESISRDEDVIRRDEKSLRGEGNWNWKDERRWAGEQGTEEVSEMEERTLDLHRARRKSSIHPHQ
jgi:hypothetical protein